MDRQLWTITFVTSLLCLLNFSHVLPSIQRLPLQSFLQKDFDFVYSLSEFIFRVPSYMFNPGILDYKINRIIVCSAILVNDHLLEPSLSWFFFCRYTIIKKINPNIEISGSEIWRFFNINYIHRNIYVIDMVCIQSMY